MNVYRIEGQEYVADSPEQAYGEHMAGWRLAQFSGGFKPAVPVLVATAPRDITVHVEGARSDGLSDSADSDSSTVPEPDFWDCSTSSETQVEEVLRNLESE